MAKKEKVEREPRGPFKEARKKLRALKKKNSFLALLIDTVTIIFWALIISSLVKTFLFRSFYIPSGSMFDTLQINDRIIVNQLVPNVMPIQRGDVVVFKDPGDWLGYIDEGEPKHPLAQIGDWLLSVAGLISPDNDQHLVKRVIGVSGDHVVCCDANNRVTINGEPIIEPYIAKDVNPSDTEFDVVVPQDSIWVLGDNRSNSEDSRYHPNAPGRGFISEKYIVGRAFIISWPFNHFKWLDNYPDVFKNVPAAKP
jgi:signal peptidase I